MWWLTVGCRSPSVSARRPTRARPSSESRISFTIRARVGSPRTVSSREPAPTSIDRSLCGLRSVEAVDACCAVRSGRCRATARRAGRAAIVRSARVARRRGSPRVRAAAGSRRSRGRCSTGSSRSRRHPRRSRTRRAAARPTPVPSCVVARRRPSARRRRDTPLETRRRMPRPSPMHRIRSVDGDQPRCRAACRRRTPPRSASRSRRWPRRRRCPAAKICSTAGQSAASISRISVTAAAARAAEVGGAHPGRGQHQLDVRGRCGVAGEPRGHRADLLVAGGEQEGRRAPVRLHADDEEALLGVGELAEAVRLDGAAGVHVRVDERREALRAPRRCRRARAGSRAACRGRGGTRSRSRRRRWRG